MDDVWGKVDDEKVDDVCQKVSDVCQKVDDDSIIPQNYKHS